MTDRYGEMATALMLCRSNLDAAISCMMAYIRLLDKKDPMEAYIMGRMMGQLELLSGASEDLADGLEGESP